MKKRTFAVCALVLLALFAAPLTSLALSDDTDAADIIEELYRESGADELAGALPEDAVSLLEDMGFSGFGLGGVDTITPNGAAGALCKAVKDNLTEPLRALCCIIGIIILSASLEAVKCGGEADSALTLVTSLCAVSVAAPPILSLTADLAETVSASSGFMLLYVPVISGLMISSGRAASGTMYGGVMVLVSNAVLQITSRVVVPLLKCVMSLSVVSSACSGVRFDGVAELFRKASRLILTFCMSIFAAFLTMRTIVCAAADSIGDRAVKFAVSSFVPLVGGALSDAYQTVVSCVSLLKSGVGAAAIAAVFAMFVPAAVRCLIWQGVAVFGSAVCGIFGVTRVSSLLSSLSSVVAVIFAVLMCTMTIYVISTAMLLIVGG